MKNIHIVSRAIEPFSPPGGLERSARWHAESMMELGFRVTVYTNIASFTVRSDPVDRHYDEVVNVPWREFGFSKKSSTFAFEYARWARAVAIEIRKRMIPGDVLHCHGISGFVTSRIPADELKLISVVLNPHGMEEFGPLGASTILIRPVLRRLVRRGASKADVVLATDSSLFSAVTNNLKVEKHRVKIIPNAVPVRELQAALSVQHPQARRIVSVGRLTHNKGYDLLAAALLQLATDQPDLTFEWTHFGSGESAGSIVASVNAAGLRNLSLSISGTSTDDEIRHALQRSSLFVQPSRYEGSSLTTLEAMAVGALVAATPVGGIPDKIRDGETGFLAASVSTDGLIDAIVRALACEEVPRVREAARRSVEDEFSLDVIAHQYEDLYRDLALAKGLS